MGEALQVVRMDKYLWAVRIYKTRIQAAEACDLARVLVNGTTVKPSRIVKVGDILEVRKPPVHYSYKVIALLGNRVSAAMVPQYLLDETPQEEIDKQMVAKQTAFSYREHGTGRPTKKERRDIDRLMNPES